MRGCFQQNPMSHWYFKNSRHIQNSVKYLWWKTYSQSCVTPAYLEMWHIHNPRHIQNTAKNLSRNILFKTLSNPDIFRNLIHSVLWYILKLKHNQKLAEYLRWSFLLIALFKYIRFKAPIYYKLPHIQNCCFSATP